jgi:outer membrane protein assembly factor BamB
MHKTGFIAARIRWKSKVATIHSRNTFIKATEGRLLVSTSGSRWNSSDLADGIYCLDSSTGNVLWFAATNADANEIAVVGGYVIVPTDAGKVHVISAKSGETKYVHSVTAPVFGRAATVEHFGNWSALLVSYDGTVWVISEQGSRCQEIGQIPGRVRATAVPSYNRTFVIATEEGSIFRCYFNANNFKTKRIATLQYLGYGTHLQQGVPKTGNISATPLVRSGRIYVGFARETYFDDLPLACLSINGTPVWQGGRVSNNSLFEDKQPGFGNIRTTPLFVGGKLIVAPAYSDSVYLLDPGSGIIKERVRLGQNVFQQWASPVAIGSSHAAIGRVDGVLSIIDTANARLVASISLAIPETEKVTRENAGRPYPADLALLPGEVPIGGICGTPLVAGDTIYVGTTSGDIASIVLKRRL